MNEQRIQVLINIANSLAIAFHGDSGGIYFEWKNKSLIEPEGVFLMIVGMFLAIFTLASYWYLLELTGKDYE